MSRTGPSMTGGDDAPAPPSCGANSQQHVCGKGRIASARHRGGKEVKGQATASERSACGSKRATAVTQSGEKDNRFGLARQRSFLLLPFSPSFGPLRGCASLPQRPQGTRRQRAPWRPFRAKKTPKELKTVQSDAIWLSLSPLALPSALRAAAAALFLSFPPFL